MKRKITAIALCAVMFATAIIGGTLAYFTDVDQNTNEFTAGGVKIDLFEKINFEDANGTDKAYTQNTEEKTGEATYGEDNKDNPNITYPDIHPGDKMTKIATVENTGKSDAYVALVVKHEGYLNFNNNVDEYYEKLPGYGETKMQKITDDVFPNWNLLYDKTQLSGTQIRYTIDTPPTSDDEGVEVLGVGYAQENADMQGVAQYQYRGEYFTNVIGQKEVLVGEPDFFTISDNGAHDRVWIVYLKLAPKAKFTMDLTTVCPTYFDNNSAQAFEGMALDVKAFAIQVDGFATPAAAFAEALKPGFGF